MCAQFGLRVRVLAMAQAVLVSVENDSPRIVYDGDWTLFAESRCKYSTPAALCYSGGTYLLLSRV